MRLLKVKFSYKTIERVLEEKSLIALYLFRMPYNQQMISRNFNPIVKPAKNITK